ncbi:MAG: HAD family hydrolase [Ignavibacteriae bacterium]|nr:HAD family hydrolase [Ignavibacteriota bacterium]
MHVGIFFDRDGTINEEGNYLSSPEQLKLIPRATKAILEANTTGSKVFIISNQAGVARGFMSELQVQLVNNSLLQLLHNEHCTIDKLYYCPHHPDYGEPPYRANCECRKPKTGMLLQAALEFHIDLASSFVVGDKLIDIQTAINAGATGILVKTGYGLKEMNLLQQNNVHPAYIAEDSYDAVQFIKQQLTARANKQVS